ncbi:MAG: cytochrome C [Planctomycetota bacterium]|jgi:hypothetical protein
MEHTKHLWRAGLLLLLLPIAWIVCRHFLLPESFGAYGYYRYTAVEEWMSESVHHGDTVDCRACHEESYDTHKTGKHASVSCHSCHPPLVPHVEGEEKVGDLPMDRSNEACALCHERLKARPKDFPQVDFEEHLKEEEVEMAEGVCLECHEAHSPE